MKNFFFTFQVCCPRDTYVYFPNEWKNFMQNTANVTLIPGKTEDSFYYDTSDVDYEDLEYNEASDQSFQACESPSECVTIDYCQGIF